MTAVQNNWPDVGELVRRVKIRRWYDNADSDFGIQQDHDTGLDRWAKIEPVSGSAYWGSKQISETMTHRIWVRWGTGTKPQDITGQHVVDYPNENQRFRVLRTTNVGDAQRFTMIEVKLLGEIK